LVKQGSDHIWSRGWKSDGAKEESEEVMTKSRLWRMVFLRDPIMRPFWYNYELLHTDGQTNRQID